MTNPDSTPTDPVTIGRTLRDPLLAGIPTTGKTSAASLQAAHDALYARDRSTPRGRRPGYFEALRDALTALWSAPRRRA